MDRVFCIQISSSTEEIGSRVLLTVQESFSQVRTLTEGSFLKD